MRGARRRSPGRARPGKHVTFPSQNRVCLSVCLMVRRAHCAIITAVVDSSMDVLNFEVDGRRYALPVSCVREVLRATAIVPLPKAPPVVQGIINIRGELVAVLDLRMRFGAARRPVRADEHFVVVHAGARTVALRADRAVGLLQVDDAALRPIEPVVARTEYVAGLATLTDGLVLIVDPAAFLSESEGTALSRALDTRAEDVREARG